MTHIEVMENKKILGKFNSSLGKKLLPRVPDGLDRILVGIYNGKNIYRVSWGKGNIKVIDTTAWDFNGDRYHIMDDLFVHQPGDWCLGIEPIREEEIHQPETIFKDGCYVSRLGEAHESAVELMKRNIDSQLFNSFGMSPLLTMPYAGWATWNMGGEEVTTTSHQGLTSKPSNGLAKCSKFLWEK